MRIACLRAVGIEEVQGWDLRDTLGKKKGLGSSQATQSQHVNPSQGLWARQVLSHPAASQSLP